jgi:hypothetical protein
MNLNIKTKKITTLGLTIATFFTTTVQTFAQGITNPVIGGLGDDAEKAKSGELFTSYFVDIWNAVITVGGLIVLVMFLWGAIEWITAGGDSSKIEKARDRILQSLIGLIILVSSFVIIGFISQLLFGEEFSLLNLSFSSPDAAVIPGSNTPGGN